MTIDLLPTIAKFIGAELPKHPIDGLEITALLQGIASAKSPHESLYFYYLTNELQAIRSGKWKLMLPHSYRTMEKQPMGKDGTPGRYRQVKVEQPQLFDLNEDLGETRDLASQHPEVIKQLMLQVERARVELGDSLTKRTGKSLRTVGKVNPN
jgi:arylsulfatase A